MLYIKIKLFAKKLFPSNKEILISVFSGMKILTNNFSAIYLQCNNKFYAAAHVYVNNEYL